MSKESLTGWLTRTKTGYPHCSRIVLRTKWIVSDILTLPHAVLFSLESISIDDEDDKTVDLTGVPDSERENETPIGARRT